MGNLLMDILITCKDLGSAIEEMRRLMDAARG